MSSALDHWDDLAAFVRDLPGTEAGTYYGGPAVVAAASGRPIVTPSREADSFVLHVDHDTKAMLLDLLPERAWETPHYAGYPALLMRYGPAEPIVEWIDRALGFAAIPPRARRK